MKWRIILPIFLIISLILIVSCTKKQTLSPDPEPSGPSPFTLPVSEDDHEPSLLPPENALTVIVSTDLIREIMYSFANTRMKGRVLIPSGVNPLTYTLTAQDKADLRAADLILYCGLGLEPGLTAYLEKIKEDVRVVALSDCLDKKDLIVSQEYAGGYDPHFWWNPRLWETVVRYAVSIFSELDFENSFNYKSVFIRYGSSLSFAARYFSSWLGRIPEEHRYVLTLHPAFAYLVQDYPLTCLSLLEPGKEKMDAGRLKHLVKQVKDNKIKVVFPEEGFAYGEIDRLIAALAADGYTLLKAEELYSYSLGKAETPEFVYIPASRELINRVYTWLRPEGAPQMPARL